VTGEVDGLDIPLRILQIRARSLVVLFSVTTVTTVTTMKINSKFSVPASKFHRDKYVKFTMVANLGRASQGQPGFPAAQRDALVFNDSLANGNKKKQKHRRKFYRGEFKQDDEGLITLVQSNVGT
jgi:hypothetical protein